MTRNDGSFGPLSDCPFLQVDETLQLMEDSRQLSSMLLHSGSKGLAGRSLLDFCAKEDHARISQLFQSSIASESTSVMALNADMLDSDQNHVKVEMFHAQFQNLANKRSFLVGVREIQAGEALGPMLPERSPSSAMRSSGATFVVFDVITFDTRPGRFWFVPSANVFCASTFVSLSETQKRSEVGSGKTCRSQDSLGITYVWFFNSLHPGPKRAFLSEARFHASSS